MSGAYLSNFKAWGSFLNKLRTDAFLLNYYHKCNTSFAFIFLCVGPKRYLNMVQCNLVTHFRLSLKKLKYWRCRSNTMICNMPIYCVTSCHWWNSNFQKLVLCFILIFFWFACVNHSSNEYQVHAAEKMARQGTEHWSPERADDY